MDAWCVEMSQEVGAALQGEIDGSGSLAFCLRLVRIGLSQLHRQQYCSKRPITTRSKLQFGEYRPLDSPRLGIIDC